MRLWSVHPRYLDTQGLTACWREALLAQTVIERSSGGYSNHPQLQRFRATDRPLASVGAYLRGIAAEADVRGFRFTTSKIRCTEPVPPIPLTSGQLDYEWSYLLGKLAVRSPARREEFAYVGTPDAHPLFTIVAGGIEDWERPKPVA